MKPTLKQTRIPIYSLFLAFLICWGGFNPSLVQGAMLDIQVSQSRPLDRIARAISIIARSYYDSSRIKPAKMLQEGLYALTNKMPEVLITFPDDENNLEFTLKVAGKAKKIEYKKPLTLADILLPIQQTFNFIDQNYQGKIEKQDQEYAFIAGLLKPLDPHSNMLPPKVFEEFKTQTSGEYGGIGIVVGLKEDDLTVIAPLEDTPAAKLGILADDKIVEIDELPTVNMPLSEAVDMLRGKVGEKVTLLIQRKNNEPFEVTITRQIITIDSVRSKVVTTNNKKIGILSIRSFQEETYLEVQKALAKMIADGPLGGIVLDLRNNPGGLLDQSLEIADRFLSSGNILYTVGEANMEEEVAKAHPDLDDITNIPLITLVDQGSASASEIVAGALKNNQRSLLIGTQTFGKGSVQSLFSLRDGSSLKLTIAQYLTPGRVSIQAIGITPDIELSPALVGDDDLDLLNDNNNLGEKNLDDHLENETLIKKSQPTFSLRYVQEVKKDAVKESEYTSKINEKTDYSLGLALKILGATTGASKLDLMTQALPLLALEAINQDNILTKSLVSRGIDWSRNTAKVKSVVDIPVESSFILKKTGEKVTELKAGDEIEWQLNIKNPLAQNLTRLVGIASAENPFLNFREFIFGKVAANATASAKISLKIPEEIIDVSEDVIIRFISEQSDQIKQISIPVAFHQKARPNIAYSLDFKDDGTEGSRGNGNHIIEKGEKIALITKFVNKGTDKIENALVNLKNLEGAGIYLREGRSTIKTLKPGVEEKAHLLFEIAKDFGKSDARIELNFVDKSTRSGLADTISFSLDGTKKLSPLPGELQIMPVIALNKTTENDKTIRLEGNISDDHQVKDLQIYLNGRKVFYDAQDPAKPQMTFDSTITLEKGLNIITLEARDERELSAKKTLVFMGPRKPLEPLKTGLLW